MAWLWSTHRDAIGAVADPWTPAERLARLLAGSNPTFEAGWHRYISSDPSVSPVGTPLPRPVQPTSIPDQPLGRIRRAVAAAHRVEPAQLGCRGPARRSFVQLATDQGWRDAAHLAEACSASIWTVRRLRAVADAAGLDAGRLCLGDDRLLQPYRLLLRSADRGPGVPESA